MATTVQVWWIGAHAADDALLEAVQRAVARVYRVQAVPYRHADRPTHAIDLRRGQHSSTAILTWLVGRAAPGGRILALTDADLFIPVLTFVYGEAQLGGTAAVVSTARLAAESGRRAPDSVVVDRVVKECVHELGHTFGLLHCDTPACVMRRSMNLIDVDAKRVELCRPCEGRLLGCRSKDGTA
jgi:archaemetzincin